MKTRQPTSPVTCTLAILAATVVVGRDPGGKIEEQALDALPTGPTFAPFSVNIYEFPAK